MVAALIRSSFCLVSVFTSISFPLSSTDTVSASAALSRLPHRKSRFIHTAFNTRATSGPYTGSRFFRPPFLTVPLRRVFFLPPPPPPPPRARLLPPLFSALFLGSFFSSPPGGPPGGAKKVQKKKRRS